MIFVQISRKIATRYWILVMALVCHFTTTAQMRQVYLDNLVPDNKIYKLSFYAPNEGFVATRDWIGYTVDSGHTFVKREITLANVNYNGYSVNLTFGFSINGVKAFNQNDIIVYGDYGFVPAILYSNNGGLSYILIYHSQFNALQLTGGITDMVFPENNSVGYAVDYDRILKTTNGGLNWSVVRTDPGSDFEHLEAVDNNNVLAFSTVFAANKLLKTTNGGSTWQAMAIPGAPANKLSYVHFLTANTGWMSTYSSGSASLFYKTTNGGASWVQQNNADATPFSCEKMQFVDANTGYALSGQNTVYKTLNSGALWEPLPRDNNFAYLGYSHNDLQILNGNQLWAGGGHGFLELNTNLAGPTLPRAYYTIDTTGLEATGIVNLRNFSRTGYTYQWLVNNVPIGTSYNDSYTHNIFNTTDTIQLVVGNGLQTDTAVKYQYFYPPVIINGFTPTSAGAGNTVTITGLNFTGATGVSFGGVPATGFTVQSPTIIVATVGAGASGSVRVLTPTGNAYLAGFTFIQAPTITSFSPTTAATGTTVTITGTNFVGVTAVSFGGVAASSFTVVSPTTITAVVPSGPSGLVSVTTPGGTASLGGFSSLPTVDSFSPSAGTQGTIITIVGSSFTGATGVSIGGVPVLSFTINNAGTITAVVGSGATGSVTVTKPAGSGSSVGSFAWYAPPGISAFAPVSGPVGTTVTITGNDFDPVAGNNQVFFGGVRATITSGTATSLTVTVPMGATFDAIRVISHNLVGYSAYPFVVTFANGGSITANSFATGTPISTGPTYRPTHIDMQDLDGDGKLDMLVSHYMESGPDQGVLLYRNIGTVGTAAFAAPVRLVLFDYEGAAAGDLDGDGKPEVVGIQGNNLIIFKNNSTGGNFSFAQTITLSNSNAPQAIAINDVDGDGKADIAVSGNSTVFRNISNPGSIAFAAGVGFAASSGKSILLTDLDGDGKPDMVLPTAVYNNFTVLRNGSTKGNIVFGPVQNFAGFSHSYITAGDMDNDGKTDLISGDYNGSSVAVMRNLSSSGNINFAPGVSYIATYNPSGIKVSDMDGDGKLDIVVAQYNASIGVFKNSSTAGNIVIEAKVDYVSGTYAGMRMLAVGDVDGDGKNDVAAISEVQKVVSVHLNNVKAEPFIQAFSPTQGTTGTTVTITGNNFTGVTAVSFGGVPATSFVVNSATSITAVVGAGASGNVSVTNALGTGIRAGYVHGVSPLITGFTPSSGPVGTLVTISGNNFSASATGNTVYFGGAKARVMAASANSLTVAVPFGSLNELISVTVNGRIAYAGKPFVTTFAGGGPAFTANSFAPMVAIPLSISCLSDVDGDGKLDLVGLAGSTNIFVSTNTSTPSNISFAPNVNFALGGNAAKCNLEDLDGDGKKDMLVLNGNSQFSVMLNTSVVGKPAFGTKSDYSTGTSSSNPTDITAGDLDGDGRADVVVSNYSTATIAVFKNNSTVGNITMAPRVDYNMEGYGNQIILSDMDGDGKQDMVSAFASGSFSFSVYLNTSITGTIAFAPRQSFGTTPSSIAIGDLDGDGKTDVICIKNGTLSVFRNLSTPGNILFAPPVDFPAGNTSFTMGVNTNDMDGDGKIDIFVTVYSLYKISVYKNNSSPGNILLSGNTDFTTTDYVFSGLSGDLDNDGKADMIARSYYGNIYRNTTGGNGPGIMSFSPVSAGTGDTVRIVANNFAGLTEVRFGGTPATAFGIEDENTVWAVVGAGASGDVVLTSASGTGSLSGFVFGTQPVISGIAPSTVTPGTAVAINGANLGNTTGVSFGGVPASSFVINSPTLVTAVVGTGASGSVTVTGANGAASFTGITLVQPPTITAFTPTSTGSGATVTINGTNFTGATAVSFGEVAATSFTVVSPTVITAVVGNGATGSVKITTPGGVVSASGYTYLSSVSLQSFYPTIGTTGSTVIINGFNLGFATNVLFGGVAASSFTMLSPSSIAAVVAGGASGNISVVTPYGTSTIAGFSFVPPTVPGIVSFAPTVAAPGTKVTINGMNFTGVTAVSFGGVAASAFTVNSPTSITATVAGGASGNVAVTTGGGTATLAGFTFSTAPYITGCFPNKANPGTQVVIKGANFATTPSNNIVYFGAVKATVLLASANSLTVVVPKGATYAPVSVTVSGLVGYAPQAFMPMFAPLAPLTASSFAARVDSMSIDRPYHVAIADMNGDGKADLGIVNQGFSGAQTVRNVTVYPNNSSVGKITLQPRVLHNHPYASSKNTYADLNGDGKLDMLVSNGGDMNAVSIYKNIGTGGNFAFDTEQLLTGGLGGFTACTADFDRDGKTDVAFASQYSSPISVYRNISTGGTISFDARLNFGAATFPNGVAADDIDGDGLPDIVVAAQNSLVILRNTSSAGTISFAAQVSIPTPVSGNRGIAIGDFDDDGKVDIAMVNGSANVVSVYKNKSQVGYIALDPRMDLASCNAPGTIAIADMDGNGKLDIVAGSSNSNAVSVLRNKSSNGAIAFEAKIDYAVSGLAYSVALGDIDSDDKPDIVAANFVSNSISVLRNQVTARPAAASLCANGSTALVSNISGPAYQWQVNTGAGFVNISDNTNYAGANTVSLQLSNVPSAWYGYQYRCLVNGLYSNKFTLRFVNYWTGAVNNVWENPGNWSCGVVPDANTDVIINSGTIVLGSNALIRTLQLAPEVSFTVGSGFTLTVLQ